MDDQAMNVLLIEDNPGDADLVRLRLIESNTAVKVNCVDRLSRGLERLASDPPSLVLLDLNLPDSHGAETFRSVLQKAPEVPIVVLSGQDDEQLAITAVHQGVQDYLVKSDITSKQLERALRYAMERQSLLRALDISRKQQLEFKNQFLSHVSHELRTPLTSIHQFVTLLLDGLAGPVSPDQCDHLSTILRSVNQLHAMIRDLLEATRAESGKIRIERRCICIADLVQQAVSMMRALADQKRVGLEMAVDSRIRLVLADPDRVLQVLINLIDNAIKFTPAEGSVMVNACFVEADPTMVYLSVSDTGRGISPEARALIFERLYQDPQAVDNNRAGLGLGLYIARELVALQGGKIWVNSELGHGCTFTFTLPLYSLPKLLAPVMVCKDNLRPAIVLVRLQLKAKTRPPRGNWKEICATAFQKLERCVYLDKDLVLPPLAGSGATESYFVVASTALEGAAIMISRIREQLELCPDLTANAVLTVSAQPVDLSGVDATAPIEERVRQVADRINQLIMAHASERSAEAAAAK